MEIVGGDDVVNWILGVICDLKLPESPFIVPISHQTENNIPLSFGWVGHLLVYESIFEWINYFSIVRISHGTENNMPLSF
ncbi:unnamed protein product [Malus baccata var. baccata]